MQVIELVPFLPEIEDCKVIEGVMLKFYEGRIDPWRGCGDQLRNGRGNGFWGRMVTGESFITDEGRKKINDEFAPLTVDMETASIAHVCHVNGIPFIAIRCITDTATHSGIGNFEENCAKASVIAKDITVALLAELCGDV